jgi:hypothetical protein
MKRKYYFVGNRYGKTVWNLKEARLLAQHAADRLHHNIYILRSDIGGAQTIDKRYVVKPRQRRRTKTRGSR